MFRILEVAEPVLLSIHDFDAWIASNIVWRSWAWQWNTFGAEVINVKPAVRPFMTSVELPLYKLVVQTAFWDLPRSMVLETVKVKHSDTDESLDFPNLLFFAAKREGMNNEDALDIVAMRMTADDMESKAMAAMMGCDEAYDVLERDDVKKVEQDIEQHDRDMVSLVNFTKIVMGGCRER